MPKGPLTLTECLNNEKSVSSKYISNSYILRKFSQLILLLCFLLKMHYLSQLPDELCQCFHVLVPPLQQLIAEAGDVLFDLFQFTCGTVGETAPSDALLFSEPDMKSSGSRKPAEPTFIHFIAVFISPCF